MVTPNSDTPYSFVWMDLRAEPMVISVPAVEAKRYYSLQLVDFNTYNFGYVGSRTTGNVAGSYLVAGPHWTGPTPAGIRRVFRSTTDIALGLFRTQLFDPADIDNVEKVQAGYEAQPLSSFSNQPAPPAAPALAFPKFEKDLVRSEFFAYLDFALSLAPALPEDRWIRGELAKIGVGPGKTFEFGALSLEDEAEILLGMKEGQRKVEAAVASFGRDVNGWRVGSPFGDAAFFHGDWLMRAAAAQAGILGNDGVEAMYPMAKVDADGQPLDCSKASYTLTFPKGRLPPVEAFWSVTMYDGKTQLLVENPIGRYLINSPMLPTLKTGADGSLTIYIQSKSPGPDRESNWLPAPDGPIYVVMRLYWPKTTPPSILPPGEGTWQPPGIRKT
ncbi:putative exported protein [Rhodovulum sp. PH10]|nr:putative exported protein [Rhodovulum sp. PH10]